MLRYPAIDPVAFYIGPFAVWWYGVCYLVGITSAWCLARFRAKRVSPKWSLPAVDDLIFYATLGIILGGRLGYMLFYAQEEWLADPWLIFKIRQGGMSFHGGLLGVMVALWRFAHQYQQPWARVIDFTAPLVPLGLAAGRIGNFINGELWGRPTTLPWGMVFPMAGPLPRHPSQLYECLLEGLLLFVVLWWYSQKPRPPMSVGGLFLFGYGIIRFLVEFVREPDRPWVAWQWLTMGQLLSIPMIVLGLILLTVRKPQLT